MAAQVETKVQASTAAAAVSGLALWALGHWVFKGSVPDVVASWVYVLVPGLLAFAAGYFARHTPRTVPPPPVLPSNVTVTPPPTMPPEPPLPRPQKTLLPPAAPE